MLATGILLAHLPRVMKRHRPDVTQVWRLTAVEQRPIPIKDQKAKIERRIGEHVNDKLSGQVLQEPLQRQSTADAARAITEGDLVTIT